MNEEKESMFNKFHNFSIDDDMLSKWMKMLESLRINLNLFYKWQFSSSWTFLHSVLNLKNKILL